MSDRVPTSTLAAAAGCSASTVQRWVRQGLLPAPVRVNKGSGVQAMYPAAALERVGEIRRLREQGLSLDEIAERFNTPPPKRKKRT